MKARLNLTQKFFLPTVIAFAVIAVLLGFEVNKILEQAMIDRAKTFVADMITLQAKKYLTSPVDFTLQPPETTSRIYSQILSDVKTKEVVRIKIWAKDTTVVYSDDPTIIGKKFPDNSELAEALHGEIASEIQPPVKSENISEQGYKQLMELYVPIYVENGALPEGAIETYYKLDSLNQSIAATSRTVYGLIFIAFVILSSVLYFLTRKIILVPLQSLNTGIKEIEKGNFDEKIPVRSSDEIGLLSKAFNEMSVGLKRLQELRNEFVFVAAHELRTPVTAIKGYISLIRDRKGESYSDDVKKDLSVIATAAQGLNQLVNDILEIARSDAKKMEIEVSECSLHDTVRAVITEVTPLLSEKNLTLMYADGTPPPEILADGMRLKEVIMNLVSNAVKYNRENGFIKISHLVTETHVTTIVDNSGMGIPADEQKHIFEKFYRAAGAKSSAVTGTGLGLFITKELVERMNGTIFFTSEEGKHTVFSVMFPRSGRKT